MDLTEGVPGGVRKSRDLQKHFGVDAKLSWQVFRLVSSADPLQASPHVPSANTMRKLLDAARKRGAAEVVIGAVADAYAAFEQHVELHAGDRSSFDSMLSSASDSDEAAAIDLDHRRAIFEGHRHIWGVEVQTFVRAVIMYPGQTRGLLDYANIRSKLGLKRLRADAPVRVDAVKLYKPGADEDRFDRDHFDPEAARHHGAPIIPAFSSSPLPELQMETLADGRIATNLVGDAVGRLGASDLTFGTVFRNAPLSKRSDGRMGFASSSMSSSPTRLAVLDVLVHRPTFGPLDHTLTCYGHVSDISPPPDRTTHPVLPLREKIISPGSGAAGLRLPDFPRYVDLIRFACDRQGWNLEEMDIYRIRLDYPVLNTALVAEFMLQPDSPLSRAT